jgi:predicted nucleotidyltransferase
MARTILQLSPQERQQFDPTRNLGRSLDPQRWERAWSKLPALRNVLHHQFRATRVVVFGSLATRDTFTHWSDIDLAVWGIAPERFYEAVAALNDLSPEIKVDLVDPERCNSAALRQIIEEEGVAI